METVIVDYMQAALLNQSMEASPPAGILPT